MCWDEIPYSSSICIREVGKGPILLHLIMNITRLAPVVYIIMHSSPLRFVSACSMDPYDEFLQMSVYNA